MTTITEKWEAEQVQSEIDHHTPTAGAMTGHILANLRKLSNKLIQFNWYIKGPNYQSDQHLISEFRTAVDNEFISIGNRLVEWNEKPASTTAEFEEYSMITEAGENKYLSADEMLSMIVADIQTSQMFIGRAIKLANNEEKFGLTSNITNLQSLMNSYNRKFQARLGNEPLDGYLDEDEED